MKEILSRTIKAVGRCVGVGRGLVLPLLPGGLPARQTAPAIKLHLMVYGGGGGAATEESRPHPAAALLPPRSTAFTGVLS